jgi:hypothetical protein
VLTGCLHCCIAFSSKSCAANGYGFIARVRCILDVLLVMTLHTGQHLGSRLDVMKMCAFSPIKAIALKLVTETSEHC